MSSFKLRAKHGLGSRRRNRVFAVAVASVMAATGAGAIVAAAAVPAFPDNVVVFPDRDFITIEGYQDHVGETATLEVIRDGTVIGSAKSVVAEGDVAFEINHPGGVCWGAGTGAQRHARHPSWRQGHDHLRRRRSRRDRPSAIRLRDR